MKHNIINQRDVEEFHEIADIEIEMNEEDIKNFSAGTGYKFEIPINKKIGTIILSNEAK